MDIAAIREGDLLGAAINTGAGTDVALFALGEPTIKYDDIGATARSCFVRKTGGQVTAAAVHGGSSLMVGGRALFETSNCGQVALRFAEEAVEAELDLYDSNWVTIRVEGAPKRVVVDGKERRFIYDPERECVRIEGGNPRRIRVEMK